MKNSRLNLVVSGLACASLIPFFAACGKDSNDSSDATRTVVIEVGGTTGLHLADDVIADSDGSVSEAEIQECSGVFEGEIEGWKISGSENKVDLQPTQAFATKITGNKNSLNLIINAKEGETELVEFPGICLVLGGNQPSVNATLNGVAIANFKVVAHGNQGKVNIKLEGGSTIPEGSTEDLGKHVTVTVEEVEETP